MSNLPDDVDPTTLWYEVCDECEADPCECYNETDAADDAADLAIDNAGLD